PAVERLAAFRVVERLDDASMDRALDERGEIAPGIAQLGLELASESAQHVAHHLARLDALDERRTQAFGLRVRGRVAFGEPLGPAPERVERRASQRMRGIARGAPELRGRVVARGLDQQPLHGLSPEREGDETLASRAER